MNNVWIIHEDNGVQKILLVDVKVVKIIAHTVKQMDQLA